MIWQPAKVALGGARPDRCNGELATCERCLHAAHMLFRIPGHRDIYTQCRNCGHVEALADSAAAAVTTFVPTPADESETCYPDPDDRR